MQVAETELVSIINNDGIDIRNIYSALDNVGTNQYIVLTIYKIENTLLMSSVFSIL